MININTKSIYNNYPIFEFKVDDLPPDSFIMSDVNWDRSSKRNSFSREKQSNDVENVIKNVFNFFNKESISKVIAKLYEENYNTFSYEYPQNSKYSLYEHIYRIIHVINDLNLDIDGFNLHKHFDNRLIFGNFLLNLVDNKESTKFYDSLKMDSIIYEAPKKKGEGVFFLNTFQTLHSINVENDRYILSSAVALNINYEN